MSDGFALLLIFLAALIYGRLCGIRSQLKRIADVAESANERARRRG